MIIDRRLKRALAVLGVMFVLQPSAAQEFMTEAGHAEFTSSVPLHTFTGESDHLVGRIDLSENVVDFYLDLTTLETGIGKRDKDMRETLETDEYPFAEFFGELDSPIDRSVYEAQPAIATGTFTIHGVSREITVNGTVTPQEDGLQLEASWTLRLEDYDIEPPSLLVFKVDEEQKIRISAFLKPTGN